MTPPVLSVQGLKTGYGVMTIVHGVSFDVAPGRITALIGGNGAGKTTLMLALAGLLPLTAGRVIMHGVDISHQRSNQRVQAGLALVPEGRKVFPTLSVAEN